MLAVSSFKPFAKSSLIAHNQRVANQTWEAFESICYLCPVAEPRLSAPNTHFVLIEEDFPTIRDLVHECARHPGWSCLINADIIVSSRVRLVEFCLKREQAKCAISLRWQLPERRVVDQGLDWFAAKQELWQEIEKRVPLWFRIGHCLWDTWMLGAFMHYAPTDCWDCTASAFIYHPKHEEREQPFNANMRKPNDGFIDGLRWPRHLLNVFA